jgi:hypothetical protein
MAAPYRWVAWVRRRLRLGVGGLMVVILLFGFWLGHRVQMAREQRIAVAAVKADRGLVRYADEFSMGPVKVIPGTAIRRPSWGKLIPGKGPIAPAWLREAIGDEYFREVAHVSLFADIEKGSMFAPNNLARPVDQVLLDVRTQSGVRTLQVGGETLTDEGLKSVADLTNLRELVLWWATGITDAGVAHLRRMPNLRMVNISLSGLTDEGVDFLSELPALEDLDLEGKKFTDRSLLSLSKARNMKSLVLSGDVSEISDEGLEHLKGLKELRNLRIGENSKITPGARKRLIQALPGLNFF